MAAPQAHHLFHHPIADHSFSADKQTLAVARDNNIELYQASGSKFVLQDELKGHDKTVTGVDIAPNSGRIVTCSQGTALFPAALRSTCDERSDIICNQIATRMSGSAPQPAGSRLWSSCVSTAPRHMYAGHRRSRNSPSALEPASLRFATSKRRTTGGSLSI